MPASTVLSIDDGSLNFVGGKLNFSVTNRANRWLAVYYQAFDADGNAVTDKTYLRMIGSGNCMFGAWLPTDSTDIALDVPDTATSVDVLLGGARSRLLGRRGRYRRHPLHVLHQLCGAHAPACF